MTPVIASSPWYMARLTSYPSGSVNSGATNSYIGLTVNGIPIYNDGQCDSCLVCSFAFKQCSAPTIIEHYASANKENLIPFESHDDPPALMMIPDAKSTAANANSQDAYLNEKQTFDGCYGHVSPNPQGLYHYHSQPASGCVYADTTGQHSPVYAVMADGIPL